MKAVILAAGRGTRLMPLTNEMPKAMIKVNGKPLLEIIVDQLRSVGVKEIIIIVHYLKEVIEDYFGNGKKFAVKVNYAVQEEMLGTAHALCCAQPYLQKEKFLCISADSLFPTELMTKIMAHSSSGVCTAKEVDNPAQFGIFELAQEKIVKIIEKPTNPPSNLANFSVYLFPPQILSFCENLKVSARGEFELTDAIQGLIDQGVVFEAEITDKILDIGTHDDLELAQGLAREFGL